MYILVTCSSDLGLTPEWTLDQPVYVNTSLNDREIAGCGMVAVFKTYEEAAEMAKGLMRDDLDEPKWTEVAVSECNTAFLGTSSGVIVTLLENKA
jgi:hypothetical protein